MLPARTAAAGPPPSGPAAPAGGSGCVARLQTARCSLGIPMSSRRSANTLLLARDTRLSCTCSKLGWPRCHGPLRGGAVEPRTTSSKPISTNSAGLARSSRSAIRLSSRSTAVCANQRIPTLMAGDRGRATKTTQCRRSRRATDRRVRRRHSDAGLSSRRARPRCSRRRWRLVGWPDTQQVHRRHQSPGGAQRAQSDQVAGNGQPLAASVVDSRASGMKFEPPVPSPPM